MKVFNLFFIFVFVLFAGLQYNDPDPYIWIPIYLYAAFICFQTFRKKYTWQLYLIGFVVYISYALYLFFDKTGVLDWVEEHDAENIVQSMKATKPWIEETREFGGLLIVVVVLLIDMFWLKSMQKKAKG